MRSKAPLRDTCPSRKLVRRDFLAVGETDPLLTGYGEMACDPRSDTAVHDSHAAGVGAGEPRTPTTSRRVEGAPAAPTADGDGPALLGREIGRASCRERVQ